MLSRLCQSGRHVAEGQAIRSVMFSSVRFFTSEASSASPPEHTPSPSPSSAPDKPSSGPKRQFRAPRSDYPNTSKNTSRKPISTEQTKANDELKALLAQKKHDEFFKKTEEMKQNGPGWDTLTYLMLQNLHLELGKPEVACELAEEARVAGKINRNILINGLKAASAISSIDRADKYFAELDKHKWLDSVAPFDFHLRVCEKTGSIQSCWKTFHQMKLHKLPFSEYTLGYVARTCIKAGDFLRLGALLPVLDSTNTTLSPMVLSNMFVGASQVSDEVSITYVLDKILSGVKVPLYSTHIHAAATALGVRGDVSGMEKLYKVCELQGQEIDVPLRLSMLEAYAVSLDVAKTTAMLNQQLLDGLKLHTRLMKRILECLSQSSKTLDEAYFTLVNTKKAGQSIAVGAINFVIQGCANTAELDRAFATFADIEPVFGCTPDVHSYNTLILACATLRQTTSAFRVFEELTKAGLQPTAYTYTTLIITCVRDDDLDRALSIYRAVQKQDTQATTFDGLRLLIQKAAKDGRTELAQELMVEMEKTDLPVHKGLRAYVARGKVDYMQLEQTVRSKRPQQQDTEAAVPTQL